MSIQGNKKMEDKDIKNYTNTSSLDDYIESKEKNNDTDLMTDLDFLTKSLDDIANDFDREISIIEQRASKTLADYGVLDKNGDVIISRHRKNETEAIENTTSNDVINTKANDKSLSSIEKAQELIDNINNSLIFDDIESKHYDHSSLNNDSYHDLYKQYSDFFKYENKEEPISTVEEARPIEDDNNKVNETLSESPVEHTINNDIVEPIDNKPEDNNIEIIDSTIIDDAKKEIKPSEDEDVIKPITIINPLAKEEKPIPIEEKPTIDIDAMIANIQSKVEQVANSQNDSKEELKEEVKEETPQVSIVESPTIEQVKEGPTVEEIKEVKVDNIVEENKKTEDNIKETKQDVKDLKKSTTHKNLFNFDFAKKKESKNKTMKTSAGGSGGNNGNNNGRKKKKDDRPKGSKLTFTLAIAACIVLFLGIVAGCGALWFANRLCINKPEFSAADLESADSSIIYDSKGNQVIELGLYLRENIEYDELPNCVIDAFVSIEDSRYFEHFGFDIPRFTKAIIENLKSGSFAQGGSTITMQLVKNSYFQVDDDEDSTMAARSGMSGVQRKMQEIVLAMEADHTLSKQEIFVLFLNKVNFGDNIRGIQKAAEYYFGKDARELELNEAAFLAGIINAPNLYNPYNEIEKYRGNVYLDEDINYLENANDKKNQVLDLMAYHGYITEKEAKLNKAVKMENLVSGKSKKFGNTNTYYQSYIDAVITEAQKVTGKNPYTTAMNIYTTMDQHLQEYVYDMQNNPEKFEDKYVFRHENQQNALVIMNNQTGELIALGGGRNQADEARQFNRAVDSYINPGSSIKPVIEYVLAFDKLGYATSHTVTDQPVFLYETDIVIANAYGQGYTGDMLITEALARSLNTPAIQLMNEVIDKIGEDEVIKYCQSIGLDWCNKDTFDIQWAIGGKDCLVSPVQLAGAHGMIIHGGKYVAPHCIQRIEYRGKYNETPDYIADTEGVQVVSPAAAYMTSTLLRNNVTSGWINQLDLLKRDYPTYAKTGTTNFSEAAYTNYNIPETAAKDQWVCCQTPNYTIVVWNGFDKLADDAYFTVTDENYNLKCKMGSMLIDEVMNTFNYDPKPLEQPDDCIEISHIKGCFPYAIGNGVTGLISKNSPYATPIPESEVVKEKKGGTLYHTVVLDAGDGNATIHWDEFNAYGEGTVDMSVTSVSGKKTVIAFGRSYYPRYNFINPGMFYATLTTGDGQEIAVESPTPTITVETGAPGPYSVCGWTATNPNPRCSSQTQ